MKNKTTAIFKHAFSRGLLWFDVDSRVSSTHNRSIFENMFTNRIAFNEISGCRRCDLCANQRPLLQRTIGESADIFFVGLPAVIVHNVDENGPLSSETRSGKLLREIASPLSDLEIYFTNAVKCLPLENGRIRYPNRSEMDSCFDNLRIEIETLSPKKIVMFGKQVSNFMVSKLGAVKVDALLDEGFSAYRSGPLLMLSAPHPSYILVYRRNLAYRYSDQIKRFLSEGISGS